MSKPEMTAQQPKKGAAKSFFKRSNTELSIFLLIVLLFVLFSFFTKNFFSWYNIHNLFKQSVVIGIISIALSFVFVTGRTDLSVGTTAGLSAMIVALLMSKLGMNPWLAIIIAVGLSTLCGLFNGIIIYDLKVVPFIATMGTSGVVRGLIKYMSNAMTIGNLDPGAVEIVLVVIHVLAPPLFTDVQRFGLLGVMAVNGIVVDAQTLEAVPRFPQTDG